MTPEQKAIGALVAARSMASQVAVEANAWLGMLAHLKTAFLLAEKYVPGTEEEGWIQQIEEEGGRFLEETETLLNGLLSSLKPYYREGSRAETPEEDAKAWGLAVLSLERGPEQEPEDMETINDEAF